MTEMQAVFMVVRFIIFFTVFVNSCSPPYPQPGQLYISKVQLLSETSYADSVLLTIDRTTSFLSLSSYITSDPWCKIMNIHDGSVGDTVPCADYNRLVRPYAEPDIDPKSTSVNCHDNCDGTAICTVVRDGIRYTIIDIPYLETPSTGCNTDTKRNIFITSFTVNDLSTTYVSFSSKMIAIQFDDNVSPSALDVYTVEKRGEWSYLTPGEYGLDASPSIYSNANVMRIALPCCLCHGSRLVRYNIVIDTVQKKHIFTLNALGFGGGNVDSIMNRVYNPGLFYSQSVTIYDLSNDGATKTARPNLCDVMVNCFASPCAQKGASCPYNANARCIDDFCGGCNARWFCGSMEITNYCDSGQISNQICNEDPRRVSKMTVV